MCDGFVEKNPSLKTLAPEVRELVISNMLNAIVDFLIELKVETLLTVPETNAPIN